MDGQLQENRQVQNDLGGYNLLVHLHTEMCHTKESWSAVIIPYLHIGIIWYSDHATPFLKGGGKVSTFEAMYLMIAFATLVVYNHKTEITAPAQVCGYFLNS
jgi:hypothetical protein